MPRSFTQILSGRQFAPVTIDNCLPKRYWCTVSVLPLFSLNLFWIIHVFVDSAQDSKSVITYICLCRVKMHRNEEFGILCTMSGLKHITCERLHSCLVSDLLQPHAT